MLEQLVHDAAELGLIAEHGIHAHAHAQLAVLARVRGKVHAGRGRVPAPVPRAVLLRVCASHLEERGEFVAHLAGVSGRVARVDAASVLKRRRGRVSRRAAAVDFVAGEAGHGQGGVAVGVVVRGRGLWAEMRI